MTETIYNVIGTEENYLNLLGCCLMPACDEYGALPKWFMQDSAPPHYALSVRYWLGEHLTDIWVGRRGPMERAPRLML
jgi:hypothetical protein